MTLRGEKEIKRNKMQKGGLSKGFQLLLCSAGEIVPMSRRAKVVRKSASFVYMHLLSNTDKGVSSFIMRILEMRNFPSLNRD